MVCYFIGGAIGSVAAGTLYDTHGWAGVCLLGAGFGVLTLALSAYEWVRPLPGGRSESARQQAVAPARPAATTPTTTEA
jgi:MFS family permease